MRVKIIGSDNIMDVTLIDTRTYTNYVQDFIGNHGGFNGPNAPFQYDRETDCWLVSADDWRWWNEVIVDNQNLADRILSLSKKHGSDTVAACIASCGSCDLEDHAALVNAALDENF